MTRLQAFRRRRIVCSWVSSYSFDAPDVRLTAWSGAAIASEDEGFDHFLLSDLYQPRAGDRWTLAAASWSSGSGSPPRRATSALVKGKRNSGRWLAVYSTRKAVSVAVSDQQLQSGIADSRDPFSIPQENRGKMSQGSAFLVCSACKATDGLWQQLTLSSGVQESAEQGNRASAAYIGPAELDLDSGAAKVDCYAAQRTAERTGRLGPAYRASHAFANHAGEPCIQFRDVPAKDLLGEFGDRFVQRRGLKR